VGITSTSFLQYLLFVHYTGVLELKLNGLMVIKCSKRTGYIYREPKVSASDLL